MKAPTHTTVETKAFTTQLAKLGVSDSERGAIYDAYAANPNYGAVEPGTGGLRKGRIAKDETGKSGGYRVFSFFADERNPVFLLWIIDKSRDAALTDEQKAAFKKAITELKKECK
jgi:hypothetical protein